MHKLTNKPGRAMQLRISMEKFSGTKAINFYDAFSIGDEVLDWIFLLSNQRKDSNYNQFFRILFTN